MTPGTKRTYGAHVETFGIDLPVNYHRQFLIGGVVNVLGGWVAGKIKGTPESLTDTALSLIESIQHSAEQSGKR